MVWTNLAKAHPLNRDSGVAIKITCCIAGIEYIQFNPSVIVIQTFNSPVLQSAPT
jgi:hypothetical protein